MDAETIAVLAHGGKAPESAYPYEWLLWYRLRDLYQAVAAGEKSIAKAKEEKITAINSYQSEKELWERNTKFFQTIEQHAIRYSRERTVENADALYKAIYRMAPGGGERK